MILGDSSSSSDESYLQASTSHRNTSNFTVSTHSAFQLNVPKPIAQRATTQNQEMPTTFSRLDEADTNSLSDNLNNESSRDNNQDNRNPQVITRNPQETIRSQESNNRRG